MARKNINKKRPSRGKLSINQVVSLRYRRWRIMNIEEGAIEVSPLIGNDIDHQKNGILSFPLGFIINNTKDSIGENIIINDKFKIIDIVNMENEESITESQGHRISHSKVITNDKFIFLLEDVKRKYFFKCQGKHIGL